MTKEFIKLLTLTSKVFVCVMVILASEAINAQSNGEPVVQEKAKSYLRWNFFTDKDNLVFEKRGNTLLLKTLNSSFFDEAKRTLQGISLDTTYISDVKFLTPDQSNNVSTIEIKLANDKVEIFNFFRDREKKHVLDFWREGTDEEAFSNLEKQAKGTKKNGEKKQTTSTKVASANKPVIPPKLENKTVEKKVFVKEDVAKKIIKNEGFRDYRYGAALIWDYDSLGPDIPATFDLRTKTPEHFYPIVNRNYSESEKESHLQLAINLYRKEKYGLMYKSIKLFREKYGEEEEVDFIEYLKANAILRDNISQGKLEPTKMAINMLNSIGDRTTNYDLKKAIYKYLLTFYKSNGEFVETLKIAKRLYVSSKENFDYEESQNSANYIVFSLAQLNQIDRLSEVINEKTIRKILSRQLLLAYELYTLHKLGKLKDVVTLYEKRKSGLAKPIDPSILFNAAEAYFRLGKYKQSIAIFDDFVSEHSYHTKSSEARLRMALSYEIMDKDVKKTIVLYKNAINRSQDRNVSVEARIRYAALRSVRKIELKEEDLENRAFLDFDENTTLTNDHLKLLRLVRLRTLIVDGKYNKALTYLSALPLSAYKPMERRIFEADGAEIVYGIIQELYENSEYSMALKEWSRYKEKYIAKVANDPYMNFIIGNCYLKLSLYDAFDKTFTSFKDLASGPVKTFPIWIERREFDKTSDLLAELEIKKNIKLKNWALAKSSLEKFPKGKLGAKKFYFLGTIEYAQNNYKSSAKAFENYLSQQKKQQIFDPLELSEMMNAYTDSLYQLGELDKFQKVTEAILADTTNYAEGNPFMKSMRERLRYLNIEILSGDNTGKSSLLLEAKVKSFLKDFPNTNYLGRCQYLLGMALAKNRKPAEARAVFEKLLTDDSIAPSIKELVKSELSLMAIKERTI